MMVLMVLMGSVWSNLVMRGQSQEGPPHDTVQTLLCPRWWGSIYSTRSNLTQAGRKGRDDLTTIPDIRGVIRFDSNLSYL